MVSSELKAIVESVIFASEEEIGSRQIKEIIDSSGLRISVAEIEEAVRDLNDEYRKEGRAFEIMSVAGGFSYATRKDYSRFVGKLYEEKQRKKLSQSAIETLSIIAYKQPITRNEIEFVRGVNVDYIVNSLLERDLITIQGRADSPGRPILYGTTKNFLKVLGLNSLEDLPKLKEINEILKNEEIEGITEADIELFNSVSSGGQASSESEDHQLTLITGEEQTTRDDERTSDAEDEATDAEDEATDDEDEATDDEDEATDDEDEATDDEDEATDDEDEATDDEDEATDDEDEATDDEDEATDDEDETTDDEDETTDAKDETTDAKDETTDAKDETTDAKDETTDAKDETTDAKDETTDTEMQTGAEDDAHGNNEIIKQEGSFEEGVREEERQDTFGQEDREDGYQEPQQ
ncbi:MAG: SMC-Scp complex subunit ScpB [Ignavibacteria bacterium]|nr:SMC-Scp complex subunit ScpB [Ignavibacteria bacterium]